MGTLGPDTRQPNLQYGERSKQRLLVPRYESLHTLRWRTNRRIVDVFRRGELVPDRLQTGLQIRPANAAAEGGTVADQQPFELMHHDERDESSGVEPAAHCGAQIDRKSTR